MTTPNARYQIILAFLALCLLVVTVVWSWQQPSKSVALLVLLTTIFTLSACSALLERGMHRAKDASSQAKTNQKEDHDEENAIDTEETDVPRRQLPHNDVDQLFALVEDALRPTPASVALVFVPSITLSLLLLIRILFVDHFGTDPVSLNFGPKHCNPDEPNVSFGLSLGTFGHCLQGILATLLAYPAVRGTLARLFRSERPWVLALPRTWVLLLTDLGSYAMTLYPVYNFIKRMIKSPDTFATSSYMNNGCEWAFGALLGLSLGMLVTSLTKKALVQALREAGVIGQTLHPFASIESDPQRTEGCPARLCLAFARLLGVLFFVSVIAAAVVTGMTWNSC